MPITIAKVLLQADRTARMIHIHIFFYYQCYSNFILQHYVIYKSTQIGLGQINSWKKVNYFTFLANFLVNYFWKLVANYKFNWFFFSWK